MTSADFRRIALGLEGAEESSHMGAPDFRIGGRIFATLASASQGYGNLKLTPEQQAAFVAERPRSEESSHMGAPDFRIGGRIFATLASASQGYGNLKLTPEQQAAFVAERP